MTTSTAPAKAPRPPAPVPPAATRGSKAKAWRDIWGAGQGIGAVTAVEPVAARVDRLEREYRAAGARLTGTLSRVGRSTAAAGAHAPG